MIDFLLKWKESRRRENYIGKDGTWATGNRPILCSEPVSSSLAEYLLSFVITFRARGWCKVHIDCI
ncbi:hypothetical protein J2T15_001963 [Paenibacillus harenae]|uniref:Uncharacterized protein n=1 Tax=Paenibacillus harenae TaxID=306543 RepID=A0ABT9TYT5_PAEHA|nr:hypothetical protein [Paenibacillus harenae]